MDMLIDTETLERELGNESLRVLDATLHFAARGEIRSGRADWEEEHIPGSRFVDLLEELSLPESELPFTRPSTEQLDRILGEMGIALDSKVVVYSRGPESSMWATRLWWLLRSAGVANVALLDGSFAKWKAEGRPTSTESCRVTAVDGKSQPDDSWWATADEVLAAIDDGGVCTLNALPAALHAGEVEMGYRRPGRIAGSQNTPFSGVLDPETGTLRSDDELRAYFQLVGGKEDKRVISYCGGGIAATLVGFALRRIGYSNVGVYDGSLNEWSRNGELPMETGD